MTEPGLPRYSDRSHDLARFRDDPADAAIESYVRESGSDTVEALDQDSAYALMTFARRAAARALRVGDLETARLGIRALTLVDVDRVDRRDFGIDFPLYALRVLGGDLRADIEDAVRRSPNATAGYFKAARGRAKRSTLASCLLVQISTRYGIGFIENRTQNREPPVTLAEAVVPLLDLLDEEGTYRIWSAYISDLPGWWFGEPPTTAIPNSGSIALHGDHVGSERRYALLGCVAELTDAGQAERLAASLNTTRPAVAVAVGPRLCLFSEMEETPEGLGRLAALAETVL